MIKRETSDILRLVPGFEDSHPFVKHVGLVEGPERDVVLTARHYLIAVERVELHWYHCVYWTLNINGKKLVNNISYILYYSEFYIKVSVLVWNTPRHHQPSVSLLHKGCRILEPKIVNLKSELSLFFELQ